MSASFLFEKEFHFKITCNVCSSKLTAEFIDDQELAVDPCDTCLSNKEEETRNELEG